MPRKLHASGPESRHSSFLARSRSPDLSTPFDWCPARASAACNADWTQNTSSQCMISPYPVLGVRHSLANYITFSSFQPSRFGTSYFAKVPQRMVWPNGKGSNRRTCSLSRLLEINVFCRIFAVFLLICYSYISSLEGILQILGDFDR